jgi:hypothetical protein
MKVIHKSRFTKYWTKIQKIANQDSNRLKQEAAYATSSYVKISVAVESGRVRLVRAPRSFNLSLGQVHMRLKS